MRHDRIIKGLSSAIGSQIKLAEALGLHPSTICHWQDDGIPARRWPDLLKLASKNKYDLTLDQLASGSPLIQRQRAA